MLCEHCGLAGKAACQPGSLFPIYGIFFLGEELALLGLAVLIVPVGSGVPAVLLIRFGGHSHPSQFFCPLCLL